jgi:hypothetical protein
MKKLKFARVTLTYYGVGKDYKRALKDAWASAFNDVYQQRALSSEEEIEVEETNFSEDYLEALEGEDK